VTTDRGRQLIGGGAIATRQKGTPKRLHHRMTLLIRGVAVEVTG
jgi:hypothetical protein